MNQPCAFHDQSMEQLRAAVLDLKDQMRQAIDGVAVQSRANGETLVRIAESQVARRELCARQEQRLSATERGRNCTARRTWPSARNTWPSAPTCGRR